MKEKFLKKSFKKIFLIRGALLEETGLVLVRELVYTPYDPRKLDRIPNIQDAFKLYSLLFPDIDRHVLANHAGPL